MPRGCDQRKVSASYRGPIIWYSHPRLGKDALIANGISQNDAYGPLYVFAIYIRPLCQRVPAWFVCISRVYDKALRTNLSIPSKAVGLISVLWDHLLTIDYEVSNIWTNDEEGYLKRAFFVMNRYATEALLVYNVYGGVLLHVVCSIDKIAKLATSGLAPNLNLKVSPYVYPGSFAAHPPSEVCFPKPIAYHILNSLHRCVEFQFIYSIITASFFMISKGTCIPGVSATLPLLIIWARCHRVAYL